MLPALQRQLIELVKFAIYRAPLVGRLMSPRYSYKVDPSHLAAMVDLIDTTRDANAAVIEIGVAQGGTSAFLLEHLKTTSDPRSLILCDTFSGFTEASIAHEVTSRGKRRHDLNLFRYGDERRLQQNLRRAGYTAFRTVKGDAAKVDWSQFGPIGAVLLDIDLYQPTKAALAGIYPNLVQGGGIVVDDCREGTPFDGSLQAYSEFTAETGLPFRRIGSRGGLIVKQTERVAALA